MHLVMDVYFVIKCFSVLNGHLTLLIFLELIMQPLWILLILVGLNAVNGNVVKRGPTSGDFFPEDLTTVKWSHGTNSIAALDAALNNPDILMLEADVLMGYLTTDGFRSEDRIPVMAHGPEITSDLSFEMFLVGVMEFNGDEPGRKGIKLDFKDVDAVEPVLQVLVANGASEFQYPVWFNADILRGPINAISIPIHAPTFLGLTTQYLPEVTLSTGWKTRFGEGGPVEGSYTLEHMDGMIDTLISHNVSYSTPVTYPIRTGLGSQSISQIVYLLERSSTYWEDSTITLWHGGEDPEINLPQLELLIETIGRDRCFADIGIDV